MFGALLWNKDENKILLDGWAANKTPAQISSELSKVGFSRTPEAVARRLRRMQPWNKPQDPVLIQPVPPQVTAPPKEIKNIKWISGPIDLGNHAAKFVFLTDIHWPDNICLDGILAFLKDFKPTWLILGGDILNNDPFNHWEKEKPRGFKLAPQPKPYYERANKELIQPLRNAVGDLCTIVYMKGNHEWWSNKAIDDMPEGEGYWEVENNIEDIDWWVESKGLINLGHLYFTHGDIIKGGRNHATKMLDYFNRRNIRYGHYHGVQSASHTSPIDIMDRHIASSVGCLCNFNPKFMENKPHNWINAFNWGIVEPDGSFYDYTTVITDNRFWANGKFYG